MRIKTIHIIITCAAFILVAAILSGCATAERPSVVFEPRFDRNFEIISLYPRTDKVLMPLELTASVTASAAPRNASNDVLIMVHPAYSVFFRDLNKEKYSDATYRLIKKQFDNETTIIREQARAGKIVILVVPGNYTEESISQDSYVAYLNTVSAGAESVYYVLSTAKSSGTLPANEMVNLYLFLQKVKAGRVMLGGGYIGRCQREFYNQLTNYLDRSRIYLVPEISSISPDDVHEGEVASRILGRLLQQDYSPIKKFIDERTGGAANILSIQQETSL